MSWTEVRSWTSLSLDGLTLLVLYLTLKRIKEYVVDTSRIATASNEQAEAAQRPYIIAVEQPRKDIEAIMDSPDVMELPRGDVVIRNIGPGAAVNVFVVYEEKKPDGWTPGIGMRFGYLRPSEDYRTLKTSEGMSGVYRMTVTYESMSGRRYITQQTWDERAFKERLVRPMRPDEMNPVHRPNPWEQTMAELGETAGSKPGEDDT